MILSKYGKMRAIREIIRKLYYIKSFLSFKSYGRGIMLSRHGIIVRPNEVVLGNNVFISENFHISARNLKIGNNVMIGPNLVIECDNHSYSHVGRTMFDTREERIIGSVTIEDDIWIGANVTILPNALIAEGCVIGAGSIITKNLPPYSICFGSPCKPIKSRFSVNELKEHLIRVNSIYNYEEVIKSWYNYGLIDK